MTAPQPWLAPFVEQALNEYLGESHPSAGSFPLQFYQSLSNLHITFPSSIRKSLYLLQIRTSARGFKALLSDTKNSISAIFTKPSLNSPAVTTDGNLFTSVRPGAVFEILQCEFWISDCFDPPTVELRISSVAVISAGHGSVDFAHLKKIGEEPSVLQNLIKYDSWRRGQTKSDSDKHDSMASQDFLTQIPFQSLKAANPSCATTRECAASDLHLQKLLGKTRDLLPEPPETVTASITNRGKRDIYPGEQGTESGQEPASSHSHPQLPPQSSVQVEKQKDVGQLRQTSTSKVIELKRSRQPAREPGSKAPISKKSDTRKPAPEGDCKRSSTVEPSLWQRRTAAARYVPHYARTVAADQQELIKHDASWQPPLVGQPSIHGQVPLRLLDRLSRAADEAAKSQYKKADDETSNEDEEVNQPSSSTRAIVETDPQPIASPAQQSSRGLSPAISWCQTPERSTQTHPRLPPDSSPLEGIGDATGSKGPVQSPKHIHQLVSSSVQADQETPSSPFVEAHDCGDEDSHSESLESNEALVRLWEPASTSDYDPGSANHSSNDTSLVQPQKEDPAEVTEEDCVKEAPLQTSSNRTALHEATSSLDTVRKLQVSRTPAVQRRQSDTMNTPNDNGTDNEKSYQDHLLSPHTDLDRKLPSSTFVPGTYLPQPSQLVGTAETLNARNDMPAPDYWPTRIGHNVNAGQGTKQADQRRSEHGKTKRMRASSIRERSVKRQKGEPSKNTPVATGTDPDFIDWEIKLRQQRRDDIAQMEEQERHSRKECSPAVAAVHDDNSLDSSSQLRLLRSSAASIAKTRPLTPDTHSSYYQSSHDGNPRRDRKLFKGVAVKGATPRDTFELFRAKYPRYEGGRTQFSQACQLLRRLGSNAPQAWLWDDFVFRYNNDYMAEYDPVVRAAGELPLPFELYYSKFVKKPISLGGVLESGHFSNTPIDSMIQQSTPDMIMPSSELPQLSWQQSLGIGSSTENTDQEEHQLPPPPPRAVNSKATEAESSKQKSRSESSNHSYNSSVKTWLEEVPGAMLSELATPSSSKEKHALPTPELEVLSSGPAPVRKKIVRRVPWHEHIEPPSSTAQASIRSTSSQTLRDKKGKDIAARRHTELLLPRTEAERHLQEPVAFQKPPRNAELPFAKLAAQFAELDQRRGIPKNPAQRAVDIFTWRN